MCPISADLGKPIKTVDNQGNVIDTALNHAPAKKTIDNWGNPVTDAPAAAPAQVPPSAPQAPAAPGQPASAPKDAADQSAPQDAPKDQPPTEAQIRAEYLEAQRVKRKAQELEKQARENLAKAQGVEKALEAYKNGQNPKAVLDAYGIDPIKFYQDMTTIALKEGKEAAEDPVQKELRAHKERLDQYEKEKADLQKQIQERDDIAAKNKVLSDHVIPLLTKDAGRYETLVMQYGSNAAIEVLNTALNIFNETGNAPKFEEVADEMERYWYEQLRSGYSNALKLNKFRQEFAQSSPPPQDTNRPEPRETPPRSVTLSNRQSAVPAAAATPQTRKHYSSMDERVADIKKKLGIT